MKPANRLYELGRRHQEREVRENQTPEQRERILSVFLEDPENRLQDNQHNRGLLSRGLGNEFYSFESLRAVANHNKRELEHRPKPNKPLRRLVTIKEVFAIYDKVRNANASWMADTPQNRCRVCELFTSEDPRISRNLDVMDMRKCVEILAPTLERVPPPEPPRFPDDDLSQPLADGTLPLRLDATTFEQRRATVPQMKNLIDRLRRYEQWKREREKK